MQDTVMRQYISLCTLTTAKDSLVDVLELHLANNNSLSFEDFISLHQHDIYHLCFNKKQCCQCTQGYVLPHNRVLHPPQLEILLDKNGLLAKCSSNTSTSESLALLTIKIVFLQKFSCSLPDIIVHSNLQCIIHTDCIYYIIQLKMIKNKYSLFDFYKSSEKNS
jgi:hypothetical protein